MGAVLREAARSGGVEGKAGLRVMAGASVDGDDEDADDDSVAGSVGSLDGDEEMEDAEAEELGRVLVPEVDGEEEDEAQAAASAERRRQAVLRERRGRRLFRGLVVFLNREVSPPLVSSLLARNLTGRPRIAFPMCVLPPPRCTWPLVRLAPPLPLTGAPRAV